MAVTIASTFENALTDQGAFDAWSLAFGLDTVPPDTAALILAPTNLLAGPPLSSLQLGNLTLDHSSYTSVSGLFTVEYAGTGGLVYSGLSVSIPVTPGSNPSGVCLFNQHSGHLWYVSAFSSWPVPLPSSFTWNVKITLGTCQGS